MNPIPTDRRGGPLGDLRIVELAGIGPGPFCGMVLSDFGADVIRVDRTRDVDRAGQGPRVLGRGRRSVAIDLKQGAGRETLLRLLDRSDALIEGFRPGVAERLGFGPDLCLERNPKLVYGRVTGWGQTGPWSQRAGHDINYIALSGALGAIGREGEPPTPPLNLLGNFGGGGMLLAVGILAAVLEARRSGRGQVVDAAVLEGSALLTTVVHELLGQGGWNPERGTNLLDGGAPFYGVYETADAEYLSFGAVEPQFFSELVARLQIDFDPSRQADARAWPALRGQIAAAVRRRTRAEWETLLEGHDVCFAPVLHPREAPAHAQNIARGSFIEVGGIAQPAPAPRFSRTPSAVGRAAPTPGEHTDAVLRECGFGDRQIERLHRSRAVAAPRE